MSDSSRTLQAPRVTPELLQEVTRKIVERFDPEKVILFGSHAWGAPGPDSDVDLLVVMESDLRPAQRRAQVSMACRPKHMSLHLIVRTPGELAHRLAIGDSYLGRIVREGKVLYER